MLARSLAILCVVALSACGLGQSRLNPLNWGGARSERIDRVPVAARPIVEQVVSLEAAPTPGGVIVSAVGLPPTQGWWEAELVRVGSADPSVLTLDFAILPPTEPRPAGTQPSREVLAGAFYSAQDLAGIRTIAVQGLSNRRSVSRR